MIRPRCFGIFFAAVFCFNLMGGLPIRAQIAHAVKIHPVKPQLLPGVVVEKVEKNSEAESAGLREGDVLLGWSRGDQKGKIESPFDVTWLDIEQRPRGTVELQGLRGTEVLAWHPQQMLWSIPCRPNLSGSILPVYRKAAAQFKAAKFAVSGAWLLRAADRVSPDNPAWLRAWLLARAAESFEKARELKRADQLNEWAVQQISNSSPVVRAGLFRFLADALLTRGDFKAAESFYLLALAESRKLEANSLVVARDLNRLGFLEQVRSNLSLAADYYQQALQIHGALIPGRLDTLVTLDGLVSVPASLGDMASADKYLAQMRHIADQSSPNRWTAAAIATQGRIDFYRGDFAQAEANSRRALAMFQSLGTRACLCSSANLIEVLGVLSWWRGDFERTRQYFVKALSLQQQDDPHGRTIAGIHVNLASLFVSLGKFDAAEAEISRALIITGKLGREGPAAALAYGQLGLIYEGRGNFSRAQRYLERAAILQQKLNPQSFEYVDSLNDLGRLFFRTGDLARALVQFHRALTIEENVFPGTLVHVVTLNALAQIARQTGDLDLSEDLYRRALAAVKTQTARLGGAQDERSAFRAHHSSLYTGYAHLLIARGKPENAFEVLEASRARSLLEILNLAQIDIHKGAVPQLIDREHSLQQNIRVASERRIRLLSERDPGDRLKVVEHEVADLLAEYQDVEAQIRATSPAYAALTQPEPLTAREVQTQLLDENTLLLEYSLGEERSYVFAVTPDSLNAFELPKRAVLEKAARRVHSLLTARNITLKGETEAQKQLRIAQAEAQYPLADAELSKMLLGPVASQLQHKRLLIISDGALAYIPFSVLHEPWNADAASAVPTLGTSAPLMVNHEIVNLPSASVLAVLRQQELGRKPAPKAVAVLADPVFDRHDPRLSSSLAAMVGRQSTSQTRSSRVPSLMADPLLDPLSTIGLLTRSAADIGLTHNGELRFSRLRFSRREAEEIMAVTPEGEGKEAVDFEASRATATSPELSQYRIVHFATHGLVDSVHPELSGLVFSMVDKNGRPQNGFLELQDIYNLNLPADLVVLSACETGLGKEISGEGLVGLTRGFMYAGASRVMASLWKVSDAGTAALMAEFYRAMEKDSLAPAAALRAAQIKMWRQKRWRDPYYWAAFQIQGEWK